MNETQHRSWYADIVRMTQAHDDSGCMNKTTTNHTLAFHDTDGEVVWKVVWAIAFVGIGIFLWLQGAADCYNMGSMLYAVIWFIIAVGLPYNEHTYLDFTERQIVTLKRYGWFEISKRSRPLTDFSDVVVRHLCHPDGEGGPDTYTGSVGLKAVDGRTVLWVKSFPTTQDEVPRTAYEFARKLQEMTALSGTFMGEFINDTHSIRRDILAKTKGGQTTIVDSLGQGDNRGQTAGGGGCGGLLRVRFAKAYPDAREME